MAWCQLAETLRLRDELEQALASLIAGCFPSSAVADVAGGRGGSIQGALAARLSTDPHRPLETQTG